LQALVKYQCIDDCVLPLPQSLQLLSPLSSSLSDIIITNLLSSLSSLPCIQMTIGINPTNSKMMKAQEASQTKLRAELWKRQSIEEGGLFIKYFAVLEKGKSHQADHHDHDHHTLYHRYHASSSSDIIVIMIMLGRLDFYAKEKDFRENRNPVNKKAIKLWQYLLSTDAKKYTKNVSTLRSAVTGFTLG